MPHKRAKLSVRRQNSKDLDLPPTGNLTLSQEDVPKSLLRVLQAEQVRKSFREKREREEEKLTSNGTGSRKRQRKDDNSKSLVIKHNESLKQFNRRVEEEMRTEVAEAMQTSRTVTRKANKEVKQEKQVKMAASQGSDIPKKIENSRVSSDADRTKRAQAVNIIDFAKAEQRRRLNDIVQEPPMLTKLPRGVKSKAMEVSMTGVVSMAQKHMMELERERAVNRYRELKERKITRVDP